MDVERTALPGIGLRYEFVTARGRRAAVVTHHSGRRELVIYDRVDPDTAAATLTLSRDEADGVAELLATTRLIERLAEQNRQVEGLVTEQLPIAAGSPYDGRTLGDTQARTRTGVSVVAVVRSGVVHASPRPEFRFAAEDVVVVVGTTEGASAVGEILTRG
ncbi:MAG: cation:proton antiporter regulatory subunit [Micromonosporaceae bacterium]